MPPLADSGGTHWSDDISDRLVPRKALAEKKTYRSMPSIVKRVRLLGIGVLIIGVLVAGVGLYQDYNAPACQDTIQPSQDQAISSGGWQEPGLTELFAGVGAAIVGSEIFWHLTFLALAR